MKEVINNIIQSKKFWYGFTTVMLIMFSEDLGISATKMQTCVIVCVALIIGQGLADKSCKK